MQAKYIALPASLPSGLNKIVSDYMFRMAVSHLKLPIHISLSVSVYIPAN